VKKPKLTKKYTLALETAQLHGIASGLNRESLYNALKHHFTWYPALKQWCSNDKYFREEWGILPAFQPADKEKAAEQGLYTLYELHKRAKTTNGGKPDAVIRWAGSIDRLFSLENTVDYLYKHPEHGTLPCYRYWDCIPEHLKTKTQIRKTDKKRRSKQQPKAVVDTEYEDGRYTRGGVYLLYDIRECLDKKPQTEAQKQAFQKMRETHTCPQCHRTAVSLSKNDLCSGCEQQAEQLRRAAIRKQQRRQAVCAWARKLIETGFIVLDTETTGLGSDARIVEICILDGQTGTPLINTLINPGMTIPSEASAIHNIYDKDVQDKPAFAEIQPQIENALTGKPCIIYNKAYDRPILREHGIDTTLYDFDCAMEAYARYYGDYSSYWNDFRWQSLTAAVCQCNLQISGETHRALGDCEATRALILYLAKQEPKEETTISTPKPIKQSIAV